jgi:hypothetical protein
VQYHHRGGTTSSAMALPSDEPRRISFYIRNEVKNNNVP